MQNQPLVSVILPTHNREKYLKKAIESVLSQTYKNLQLIIIDDGSTDGTPEILEEYLKKDSRIKIITNERNIGFTYSLIKAIKEKAEGKYIARIDDDDFWCDAKKLEKQVKFLEDNPDYVLCGGGVIVVNEEGKEKVRFFQPEKDEDIRKSLLFLGNFVHSSVVFRKDAYLKVGGYDEQFNFSQDRDLWLKLGKVGKLYNFQEYFVTYLQSRESRTHGQWREQMKIDAILRKKYKKDYPNYYQSILFSWLYYIYKSSFLRSLFYPISPKLRKLVFNISNIFSKPMENKPNFKISPEIYPSEKERENKETVWEHYFARKIAFLIIPFFLKTKISANQISISAIITGITGTILIMVGDFWIVLLGAILLQLWLILDKLDGIVARIRKRISKFGEFLDELNGTIIAALFFSSIGVAASKFPGFLPFSLKLPAHLFILLGILTSFFVIFRHLVFRHFEAVFLEKKEEGQNVFSFAPISIFYKTFLKFSGIYSLAQPLLILAIIFKFLGLYILAYFIIQAIAMLVSISIFIYKASRT